MSAVILPERLALLDTVVLESGSHPASSGEYCAEEFVAYVAGEKHSDRPSCVSPVLIGYTISLNDQWDLAQRQKLKPFLVRQIGTAGDGQDEARSYLALDWLIRSYTPAWLDLAGLTAEATALRDHRRIVDLVAAESIGPIVREAQGKATAAWDAAWAAAGAAARDAAWDAAGAAAGAAAWDAAGDAAWDAVWAAAWAAAGAAAWDAAWDAAGAAAWDAAWDAAWAALKPTVELLQASALDLLDRMINPGAVTA